MQKEWLLIFLIITFLDRKYQRSKLSKILGDYIF